MSENREILLERRGGVGFVLLNRPNALNALSLSLIEAFDARLEAWAQDPAVRALRTPEPSPQPVHRPPASIAWLCHEPILLKNGASDKARGGSG